jgi:hypothetical protein
MKALWLSTIEIECLRFNFSTVLAFDAEVLFGNPNNEPDVLLGLRICIGLCEFSLATLKELFLIDEALRKLPVEFFARMIQSPDSVEPEALTTTAILEVFSPSIGWSNVTGSSSSLGCL